MENHRGCVKSPVPTTVSPFIWAHLFRLSSSIFLLVALENGECICRSAIKCIALAPLGRKPLHFFIKPCYYYNTFGNRRVAQGESASLTRKRSGVQDPPRL